MRRNSQISSTRLLYERARQGDSGAAALLLERVTRELESRLRRTFSSRDPSGLREVASDAVEEALLRLHRIASWERIRAYAGKVAERAVRGESKRRERERFHPDLLEIPDRLSGATQREIELRQDMIAALRMSEEAARIFTCMLDGTPSLDVLSQELGVSLRTLKRRRRDLRERILRNLESLKIPGPRDPPSPF